MCRDAELLVPCTVTLCCLCRISAQQCKQPHPDQPTHADLDVRCLQVLRAIVHNEERKLPEDWAVRTAEEKIKK